jgi:hypothetical protein
MPIMKFVLAAAVVLLPIALAGCMGPEGNPNGMAYAGDPDGVIGAPPQSLGTVSYDPYGPVPPFEDMKAGAIIGGGASNGAPSYGAPAPIR